MEQNFPHLCWKKTTVKSIYNSNIYSNELKKSLIIRLKIKLKLSQTTKEKNETKQNGTINMQKT